MPSPKYHTRVYRRTPLTLQYELIHEQRTATKHSYSAEKITFSDILVSENLSNGLIDFPRVTNDKDGERFLALQLLGVPVVSIDQCRPDHLVNFRKIGRMWRPEDQFFYFAGDIAKQALDKQALDNALSGISQDIFQLESKLDQIYGSSKAKEAERSALFSSFEAYRAFRLGKIYYVTHQICANYNLKVVHIPCYHHESSRL